ncbi:ATP-binding protein [Streptomyces lunaelactis]|uniref:ATP-binding protein n=1 Tax=Streptomyces lunaelactis TaxID=1535768 RepID=A0A2R4T792_9ACTN|nr:ATP-binding protein [Streptomyces lunaelactis]AVZ74976.1 ATP-binding protein [Streptomyces lunaelactis]NUK85240.1 ATP-binding protein [Streptomyces lunaelactis]
MDSSAGANDREVIRRWARHPRSVPLARAELRKTLAEWGLPQIEDAALLVLSELLTNAVRHARVSPGREIETRCRPVSDGVRIEVHDTADERPVMRSLDAEAVSGRGLSLVAAVADRWDVSDRTGPGKAVWAVLTVAGAGGDHSVRQQEGS